jgi:adenylate cyclase
MPPQALSAPLQQAAAELGEAIARTLRDQARRNELVIAYVRAGCLLVTALADLGTFLFAQGQGAPSVPWTFPALTACGAAGAVALAVVLRRGAYHPALRYAVPVFEGLFIFVALTHARSILGPESFQASGGREVVVLVSALVALSGAFRLSRGAVFSSTAIGGALMVSLSWPGEALSPGHFIALCLLLGIGVLGLAVTGQVQRLVRAEVGRLMLARFLPRPVLESAHDDPLALLTRPREVEATILVSDVRGFTAWSELRPPEEVLAFLNELQGALAEIVRAEGGTVDKFLGDGMLAVFGAPEPLEGHAGAALRAARRMVEEARRVLQARPGLPAALGVGVHSGRVVVGCLGSGLRLEFTAIGDTVNTASRLEALTKERKAAILASQETVERAGGAEAHGLSPLGSVSLRGRAGELQVYGLPLA